jgi:hypothetical protein
MRKLTVVKFPTDILNNLKQRYPNYSTPVRVRLMYDDYIEMQELKCKIKKAGEVIYGKNTWNKMFPKK